LHMYAHLEFLFAHFY